MQLRSKNKRNNEAVKEVSENDSPLTSLSSSPVKQVKKVVKRKVIKKEKVKVEVPHVPPKNWEATFLRIKEYRETHLAPVDSMGCERSSNHILNPKEYRFHVLISLLLSSQTKDEETYKGMTKLKKACGTNITPALLYQMDEELLHECIKSIGFHTKKVQYIKKVSKICIEKYDNDIPNTLEGLLELPGIGPKMAFLALQCAWNLNSGIGVDIHVHRIANRLDWINTKTPEQTRVALESFVPSKYWKSINFLLVGFGQIVCLGNKPRCFECPISDVCPSVDSKAKPSKNNKVRSNILPDDPNSLPKIILEVKEEKDQTIKQEEINQISIKKEAEEDYLVKKESQMVKQDEDSEIKEVHSKYFYKINNVATKVEDVSKLN